jgi:pimeloyl-ACP methyl ester carboxylesterase
LEEDVRRSITGILYTGSGEARASGTKSRLISFDKNSRLVDNLVLPEHLPAWLSQADIDYFVAQFERSGFRGPINWYRNIDRNWALTPFLDGAKILQPTLFVTGSLDGVLEMAAAQYEALETNCVRLVGKHLIPGAGHWIQQERPTEVNELLTRFLTGVTE